LLWLGLGSFRLPSISLKFIVR